MPLTAHSSSISKQMRSVTVILLLATLARAQSQQNQTAMVNWFRPTAQPSSAEGNNRKSFTGIAFEISPPSSSQAQASSARSAKNAPPPRQSTHGFMYDDHHSQADGRPAAQESSPGRRGESPHQSILFVFNHNFLISYACNPSEQLMSVNIRSNKPFYGLIQALKSARRQQLLESETHQSTGCVLEGKGEQEFNLTFSYSRPIAVSDQAWTTSDSVTSRFCGPLASKQFRSLVSSSEFVSIYTAIVAIQLDKFNLSPDDRIAILNCTDSSNCKTGLNCGPKHQANERLVSTPPDLSNNRWRENEWRRGER